ncbi:MAG: hypothetical protein P8J25_03315 [Porticoccaceae bacterium]|nr:hypothetical protein [Porticoccaceae bacterium]
MKLISIVSLLSCLIFLASCDKNASNLVMDEKNLSQATQSYQKPGANVRLSHNYDGTTAVGEIENLQLSFTEQYSSGKMYIRLKPDASLTIEPATQNFVFSLDNAKSHPLELSVSANFAGKHLLNILASVIGETGRVSNRVMAIAFYVGDKTIKQSKALNSDAANKVIILPSQESGAEI